MLIKDLSRSYSRDLGWWETSVNIGNFPRVERGEQLEIARAHIEEGSSAYLKGTLGSQSLMIYLEPGESGLVSAIVVPGLHFVTSHGLGRALGTSNRLDSFIRMLQTGFDSPTAEENVFLLTSNYEAEKWVSGYPVQSDNEVEYWVAKEKNAQDRGEAIGDSLRVGLWSGFYGGIHSSTARSGIERNVGIVWSTPVADLEGVVVTAPGSDWNQRVSHYQRLHWENNLTAPIEIYNRSGNYMRVG